MLLLFTGIAIAAPITVLILQQANYILAYQACADRSNAWVHAPTLFGMVVVAGLIVAAWVGRRRSSGAAAPRMFVGVVATMMAVLSLLIAIAFALGPLLLAPCDY